MTPRRRPLAWMISAASLFACGAAFVLAILVSTVSAAPRLTVTPRGALMDTPVAIRVEGLRPGQEVTLRASAADAQGRPWQSEATFQASAKGVIDVAGQAALRGTYIGIDAMGLFWSMRPVDPATPRAEGPRSPIQDLLVPPTGRLFMRPLSGAVSVTVEVVRDGRRVASAIAVRQVTHPEVKVTEVRQGRLVGRLYEPAGTRRPAVLVLGGSAGGIPASHAAVLAGHGYVTFSLAYFRAEGLPVDLVEIPLEEVHNGLEWLRARPSVDAERVALVGHSRGAELALLLASTYPEIGAVIALAPSDVVWEGAVRDPEKDGMEALKPDRSAWTFEGRPLPFLPKTVTPALARKVADGERFFADEMMQLPNVVPEGARIAVEKMRGPLLMVSCRSDRMWPAATMAERAAKRLRSRGTEPRVEHLTHDDCAHAMPDGFFPPSYGGTLGGTAQGTMRAFSDYWPKLLAFLQASIGAPAPID